MQIGGCYDGTGSAPSLLCSQTLSQFYHRLISAHTNFGIVVEVLLFFLEEFSDLRYCRSKLFFSFQMFADPKRQLADNAWTGVPGNYKIMYEGSSCSHT